MNSAPLPQPKEPVRVEAIADLLNCVIEGKTAIYISVPITSGRRFLHWFQKLGSRLDPHSREYQEELSRYVIQPNCDEIATRISELRVKHRKIVINPAAFDRPEWTQD